MSTPEAASRGRLHVRLLEATAQFAECKADWQALETAREDPSFFQSYAWCGHVADVLSGSFPRSYAPLVAVGMRDGAIVAIWPLSRQKRSGIWQLRPLDDPFGQFPGLLCADANDAAELVSATLALVRQRRLAAALRIDRVIAGSPLEAALHAAGARYGAEVGAPVIDLSGFQDYPALKSSRNKKTMKNLRNAVNRLARAGTHEHVVAVDSGSVDNIIVATLRRRKAWLADKGLTAPQFRSVAHEKILLGGADWALDKMRTGFELRCDGKPIAHQWGFLHRDRYYAFMSATDPAAERLSPGRLHLAFVIEAVIGRGLKAIEFLTPASDYKLVWTDTVRTLRDMSMPLSAAGRLHDALWEKSLRPALKACFYALPAGLRRAVSTEDRRLSEPE
jgi:CelD/BcsL family acetyltransferase involved in cellulose biosynthesis